MKFKRALFCILSLLLLQGCQKWNYRELPIRNRANDYLRATLIEPIKVPEGLSYKKERQLYPLPEYIPEGPIAQVSVMPPGFGTF